MSHATRKSWAAWGCLLLALAAAAGVYIPGLHGGYTYDDVSFVLGNSRMQVTTTDLRDWAMALFSFPGGVHQGRWLGMLSFAANHYFTGLDPFWFKLTNLAIHLLNGLLVFLALRALFRLRRACAGSEAVPARFNEGLAAAAIAALWLVLPINLTGVLYVSQRLESLSSTFVFLGLWWYLDARLAYWRGGRGMLALWLPLLLCTGVGVLVKESAALLPLYAGCAEFVVARGRRGDGRRSRGIAILYACLLALPLVAGLAWLASWMFGAETYTRPFTTWQRLLSESRVLVDYMHWTLAPNLDTLTLYHDDIHASKGLFDPPSTIACVAGLLGFLALAFWQRTRRPLFAVGVLWFFAGHLLTGTIIPLLLAFEHRNYFPSVGLLLAVASLVALEGGLTRTRVRVLLVVLVFGFYGFTTWMRAEEWSDPLRLALSEASKRPDSSLAQYDRALAMMSAGSIGGRPVLDDALLVLDDNRKLPGASIMYEEVLITTAIGRGQPVNPDWWKSMVHKMTSRPPLISDAKALANFNACFIDRKCSAGDLPFLQQAYAGAMAFPNPSAALLSVHAEFEWYLQHDHVAAERDIRAAVAHSPLDPAAHRNLAILLIATGELPEARAELEKLRRMNFLGMFDKLIEPLDKALRKKEQEASGS
jgi:hypothetical protein